MLGHAQQPGKMRRIGVLMSFAVNDLRRDPLAVRKATLASLVAHAAPGLRLNEHLDHDDGQLVLE